MDDIEERFEMARDKLTKRRIAHEPGIARKNLFRCWDALQTKP